MTTQSELNFMYKEKREKQVTISNLPQAFLICFILLPLTVRPAGTDLLTYFHLKGTKTILTCLIPSI